jgi:dTDP-4-dehydrorhamnose reductase
VKVLVTGAEGQLARSLVERARGRSDIRLVAVGRPQLDLAVAGSAAAAIEALRPQVVINAAAYTAVDKAEDEPELAFRINSEGAGEVAAAAAGAGATVVQISTDYVFDGRGQGPYDESSPTNPLGVYGRSKLEGEQRVRAAGPRHAIVRTAWVYSPFGSNFVKTMMAAARTRDLMNVVADQVGSPTSAFDLADGLLSMAAKWNDEADHELGETYHLAGAGQTSWCGLAEFVMCECRERSLAAAEIHPIQTADWPTKAVRPANSVLDSRKFEREFDYAMPAWRPAVSQVVARLAADGI